MTLAAARPINAVKILVQINKQALKKIQTMSCITITLISYDSA
jgi:hypothetical protein